MSFVKLDINGEVYTDDMREAELFPVSLTLNYDIPSTLTVKSTLPSEQQQLISGSARAQLFIDNVKWFDGRYAAVTENRSPTNVETIYEFVGRKEELNGFTIVNQSGFPVVPVGGENLRSLLTVLITQLVPDQLVAAGIKGVTNLPGSEDRIPQTLTLRNDSFVSGMRKILQFAPLWRWLVNIDDEIEFFNIDNLDVVSLSLDAEEIASCNLAENSYGRYSAVRMMGIDSTFAITDAYTNLVRKWDTDLEENWTIADYYSFQDLDGQPQVNEEDQKTAIEKGNVHRRFGFDPYNPPFNPGEQVRALQKVLINKRQNKYVWIPVEIAKIQWNPFIDGSATLWTKWPALKPNVTLEESTDVNVWVQNARNPGDAQPAEGMVLLGKAAVGIGGIPGRRFPQSGFSGAAFTKYRIQRELVINETDRTLHTDKHIRNLFDAVSGLLISGSITLNTLREEFRNLGKVINLTNAAGNFGLEEIQLLVTGVTYDFNRRVTNINISSDRRPFTLGLS